jgi:hypothetical protein
MVGIDLFFRIVKLSNAVAECTGSYMSVANGLARVFDVVRNCFDAGCQRELKMFAEQAKTRTPN